MKQLLSKERSKEVHIQNNSNVEWGNSNNCYLLPSFLFNCLIFERFFFSSIYLAF